MLACITFINKFAILIEKSSDLIHIILFNKVSYFSTLCHRPIKHYQKWTPVLLWPWTAVASQDTSDALNASRHWLSKISHWKKIILKGCSTIPHHVRRTEPGTQEVLAPQSPDIKPCCPPCPLNFSNLVCTYQIFDAHWPGIVKKSECQWQEALKMVVLKIWLGGWLHCRHVSEDSPR